MTDMQSVAGMKTKVMKPLITYL